MRIFPKNKSGGEKDGRTAIRKASKRMVIIITIAIEIIRTSIKETRIKKDEKNRQNERGRRKKRYGDYFFSEALLVLIN